MEGERIRSKVEASRNKRGRTQPEHRAEASTEITPPVHNEEDAKKINIIKERLLAAGMMTIEPLEGDPFVLSREHQSPGEGVTIYTPARTVKRLTFAEHVAQQGEDRRAAGFFKRAQIQETTTSLQLGVASYAKAALRRMIARLWSKLI